MNIKKNPDTGTTSSLLMGNKEVRAQSSGRMLSGMCKSPKFNPWSEKEGEGGVRRKEKKTKELGCPLLAIFRN